MCIRDRGDPFSMVTNELCGQVLNAVISFHAFLCTREVCTLIRICQFLVDASDLFTPFAVHYEKIRNHLRETAINCANIHSLARKYEHLSINQIQ